MNLLTANDRTGHHAPSWYAATADAPGPYPPLDGDARADVCIVGAGYTGLSAALHLAQAGAGVVLLDAQRVGWGASGRNGGQVGSGQRRDQRWLEARLGNGPARVLWDIAEEAKATVRRLVAAHAPDARWRPGIIEAARTAVGVRHAHAYAEHLSRTYGYEGALPLDRAGIAAATGAIGLAGGVLDRDAGHVHPLRLAFGMARAADQAGVRIHEATTATGVRTGAVSTPTGTVTADHVILAANGYLGGLMPAVGARVMPINNFVVATAPLGPDHSDILPGDVAVADDTFVVNYWRRSDDDRLLFGGGESYGYRFPRDIAALVRPRLETLHPQLRGIAIDHAWGGTLAITRSRMPHLSRPAPGVLSASGYSGHGVAMAVMAGRLMAEAVRGEGAGFDAMAAVPSAAFPGGAPMRAPLLAMAMGWFALRDRLGV